LYHPDLIAAADLVVCKSGYSTIAECSIAGARVCSIGRPGFAESDFIGDFVQNRLDGTVIDYHEFLDGSWLNRLESFLVTDNRTIHENGADAVADFLIDLP
jgi:UDP-N-acetylglucosamine:LPS N-acetylglucosamine transferase